MPLLSIVSQKPIDVTHFIGNNAGVSYAIAQFIMNIVDWVLGVVGLEKNTTVVTVIYSIVVLGVAIVAGYIVQWIVLKIVKAIAHRWDSDMYHALTNVRFFHKICRIIYLHFRWNNWIMRLIRKRRGVVRWMTVSGLLLILSACIATIHWTATTAHTVVGAIHGKIGFIFILLTIIHIIRYRRFFIRQSRHK